MWRFLSPKIVFGKDAIEYLEKFRDMKCLIVTDEIIDKFGYSDIVTKYLKNWEIVTTKAEEPCIEDALKLAEEFREVQSEFVIALGGGSVIDVTKAGKILMEIDIEPEEITPFTDLEEYGYRGRTTLIAIPTTSGTGSEATWAIVLKNREEGRKVIMANEKAMPEIAIVDPIFVYSMPESLVTLTGFDALAHAIEAYLSSFSNPFSDALASDSAKMIFDNFIRSYQGDRDAREKMHISATMAGIAFSNSQVGIVHALAHSAGAVLGIPHGLAVLAFLSSVLEFYKERGVERLEKLSRSLGLDVLEEIKKIEVRMNLQGILPSSEIENHKNEIVEKAMEDSCIITGPFVPDNEDLEIVLDKVVRRCMQEEY